MAESSTSGSETIGTGEGGIAPMPGLEASWRSLEIAGGIIAVLGLLGILCPYVTSVSISLLLGGALVVGGLVHVAHAFRARGWRGFAGQAALAIVYSFAGLSLLANPVLGLTTLTLLLIAYLLLSGVVEAVIGLQIRGDPKWGWVLASGVVSIVLGVLLLAGFPSTAAWALGLFFGISLLSTGVSMIVVGRGVHRLVEAMESEAGAAGG